MSRVWLEEDFGNISLITLGLANVATKRKNNNRKNMISFNDPVATSGWNASLFLSFISVVFYQVDKLKSVFLHLIHVFVYHDIQHVITGVGNDADNQSESAGDHFLVETT